MVHFFLYLRVVQDDTVWQFTAWAHRSQSASLLEKEIIVCLLGQDVQGLSKPTRQYNQFIENKYPSIDLAVPYSLRIQTPP